MHASAGTGLLPATTLRSTASCTGTSRHLCRSPTNRDRPCEPHRVQNHTGLGSHGTSILHIECPRPCAALSLTTSATPSHDSCDEAGPLMHRSHCPFKKVCGLTGGGGCGAGPLATGTSVAVSAAASSKVTDLLKGFNIRVAIEDDAAYESRARDAFQVYIF